MDGQGCGDEEYGNEGLRKLSVGWNRDRNGNIGGMGGSYIIELTQILFSGVRNTNELMPSTSPLSSLLSETSSVHASLLSMSYPMQSLLVLHTHVGLSEDPIRL